MENQCPHCGQRYEVDARSVGQSVRCSRCNQNFTVVRTTVLLQKDAGSSNKRALKMILAWTVGIVLIAGVSAGGYFGVSKWLEKRNQSRIAQREAYRLVEEQQAAEKRENEKKRQEEAKKRAAEAKKAAAEKAARDQQRRAQERQREAEFQKSFDERSAACRRYIAQVWEHADGEGSAEVPEAFQRQIKAEFAAISKERMEAFAHLDSVIKGTIPPEEMFDCAEKFPVCLQSDVAQLLICKSIWAHKQYSSLLLNKIPDVNIQQDPQIYITCPECRGSGEFHCVICKDTRICQRCYGAGSFQSTRMKNGHIVPITVSCSPKCRLCEGKVCHNCGGKKKIVSPELPDKIRLLTADAQRKLAKYYKDPGDHDLLILQTIAESGNPVAQFKLGSAYQTGDSVKPDPAKAAFWYRKAAEQGLAKAREALQALGK